MGEKDTEFKGREPEEEKYRGLRKNEKEDVEGHGAIGPEPTRDHADEGDDVEGHFGLGPEPSIGP